VTLDPLDRWDEGVKGPKIDGQERTARWFING